MTGAIDLPLTLSGRYELERELGRGAMGAVYLARDVKHGREVAVKVLAPNATETIAAERFLAEVRTAAGLNHPHILPVHDSGEGEHGLLYYVMPRVEGESLQDVLERERRLPVGEATAIARQIAEGLGCAHSRGVVHRDIKPANVLLDRSGHVYLADFGLALALSSVSSTRRTVAGTAIGSPLYMSPEQCAGDTEVDARSDIYSLGCVLFEMLAGTPPFRGDNVRDVLVCHLTEPPPPLRQRRADMPPALQGVVDKALAKDPAERYPTAEAFCRALQQAESSFPGSAPEPEARRPLRRRALLGGGVAAVAVAALLSVAVRGGALPPLFGGAELDSMRYVVLPVQHDGGIPDEFRPDLQLHEAFERWRELQLVSRLQVGDAVQRAGGDRLDPRQALSIAEGLGAGRYVFAGAIPGGDSVRLEVSLHDATRRGRELRRASAWIPLDAVLSAGVFADLADELLFGRIEGGQPARAGGGTNSVVARRAYGAGHAALQVWDLAAADSLFTLAARSDPEFARAQVWVAQVRNWDSRSPTSWRTPAERALRQPAQLSEYEQALARGLSLLAGNDYGAACDLYRGLVERDAGDFAAWYGLGECRRLDEAVLRDRASPSGWSFRSSYHGAVEAYRRAFEMLPVTHRGATFDRLLDLFYTQPNRPRVGRAAGADTLTFIALPTLSADTLAFVPHPGPWEAETWRRLQSDPANTAALLHQRRLVNELAERWATAFPESPDALEALGISLDMLGDPATIETLRRAWTSAEDPDRRRRLMAAEVWARVKFGLPDGRDLMAARALADSILELADSRPDGNPLLPSLAILVGDPVLAAEHARGAAESIDWPIRIPRSVSATGAALLAFAAAGGPADSLIALETTTERAIRNTIPQDQWDRARHMLLERPATIALPTYRSRLLEEAFDFEVMTGAAYAALLQGDTAGARAMLTPPEGGRLAGQSFDMLYPTAWLLAAMGDPGAAAQRLDAAFDALRWAQPGTFDDPAHAGGLVRAIAFRSALARTAGDQSEATRWQSAFDALWGSAPAGVRLAAIELPARWP